jgi:hypothetical protein
VPEREWKHHHRTALYRSSLTVGRSDRCSKQNYNLCLGLSDLLPRLGLVGEFRETVVMQEKYRQLPGSMHGDGCWTRIAEPAGGNQLVPPHPVNLRV